MAQVAFATLVLAIAPLIAAAQAPVAAGGRVTLNGAPLASQRLVLQPADLKSSTVTITTDADGRYEIVSGARDLDYHVFGTLWDGRLPPIDVHLAPGRRDADIAYAAGVLTISTSGSSAPDRPPTVVVQLPDGRAETRTGSDAWRLPPLAFGRYRVTAITADGLVSDAIHEVVLDRADPDAEIALRLAPASFEIALASPDGSPVPAAQMTAWFAVRLKVDITPLSRGRYRVTGMPPGADLQIQPALPYGPICRVAPVSGVVLADVSRGRPVHVVWSRTNNIGPIGTLSGGEGSDCPVPLALYRYTRAEFTIDGFPSGRIDNFPTARDLVANVNAIPLHVVFEENGLVRIR